MVITKLFISLFSIITKTKNMARRSSFDYQHTCPKIDKAIVNAKDTIERYVLDIINDTSPHVTDEKANELSKQWTENIYNDISDCFETVRETNEDMRAEANKQIDALESQIKELERQL